MAHHLSQQQINEYVTAHNNARSTVNPRAATPLQHLAWSDDLATQAGQWASQCTFGHSGRPGVGENIYITTNPSSAPINLNPQQPVQSWDDEKQYYDYNNNTCEPGKMCGHYTQIVWEDSQNVGCAVQNCPVLKNNPFTQQYPGYTLAVCQYTPPGNMNNERPYAAGNSTVAHTPASTLTPTRHPEATITPAQRHHQFGEWPRN